MASHIYLAKDSNDLISHCRCPSALMGYPAQANCPWCGCGWLFTCIVCQRAFSFARAIEIREPWESLAERDLTARTSSPPTDEEIQDWCQTMQEILADVVVGQRYVCLDGSVIPVDAERVRFDGWRSRHTLPFVPQVEALTRREVLEQILGNPEYWWANELGGDTLH